MNQSIHPYVIIKNFPYMFEIPKMHKFNGKEDPR